MTLMFLSSLHEGRAIGNSNISTLNDELLAEYRNLNPPQMESHPEPLSGPSSGNANENQVEARNKSNSPADNPRGKHDSNHVDRSNPDDGDIQNIPAEPDLIPIIKVEPDVVMEVEGEVPRGANCSNLIARNSESELQAANQSGQMNVCYLGVMDSSELTALSNNPNHLISLAQNAPPTRYISAVSAAKPNSTSGASKRTVSSKKAPRCPKANQQVAVARKQRNAKIMRKSYVAARTQPTKKTFK